VPFLGIFGALDSVVCTTQFPPRIEGNGSTVDVVTSGKKLTLAAKALPSLRLLLSGRPVLLNEVAAVVGSGVAEVAAVLVEEKICAPLTPELPLGYTDLVTNAIS